MAGFSMLAVLALDAFTSLEMTPRFAALFVTVTTMAFAGVWVMGEFALDAVYGTELIAGQRELNVKLLVATLVGLLGGVGFAAYFRETDGAGPLEDGRVRPTFGARASGPGGPADRRDGDDGEEPTVVDPENTDDGVGGSPKHRLVLRALQATLVAIVGYAVATLDGTLFVNSVVPLALTLLPAVVRQRYGYPMHADLALLVSVAATLHAVGALGPYATTDWYDTVTHALSSTLVAGVGYALAHGLELHTDHVDFSPRFRGAFVVVFVLAVGVLWELFEFASGLGAGLLGGEVLAQYGVVDIVKDLAFNTVGALAVALFGTKLFRRPARALAGQVGDLLRRG